jgi:hypothetical protein
MKNILVSLVVSCGFLFSSSAWGQTPAHAKPPGEIKNVGKQLVGVWRLTRYVDTPAGAAPIYAFGEHPVGQFIFTSDGNFSINIMRNPPEPSTASVDIDPDACIPAWYCSYFGTYRLAENGRQWIALVEGGNIPTYVGTHQTRTFELLDNRLLISESYEEAGRTVRAERVLERTPPI